MNGEDGSLPPAGRFQRIEDSLQRIEDKLDTKAETATVEAMKERLTSLETTRTADALLRAANTDGEKSKRSEKKANIALVATALTGIGLVANVVIHYIH